MTVGQAADQLIQIIERRREEGGELGETHTHTHTDRHTETHTHRHTHRDTHIHRNKHTHTLNC